MDNIGYAVTLLSSIMSKLNMVGVCLYDELGEELDEVKFNIKCMLNKYNCDTSLSNDSSNLSLDMVSLYEILNEVSRDLGTCILLTEHDEALEDAAHGVSFIIKIMAKLDSDFGCCYENAKKRVLK